MGKRVINVKNQSKIQFVFEENQITKNLTKYKMGFCIVINKSHYKICKFYLENKINVFCEKPINTNYKQSKYLFNIASKNKCVLYVDDIETFKNKKIILKIKILL